MYVYLHTHIQTDGCVFMYIWKQIYSLACLSTYIHTYIHTHIHDVSWLIQTLMLVCLHTFILYTICSFWASEVKHNMIFSHVWEYTTCICFYEAGYLLVHINIDTCIHTFIHVCLYIQTCIWKHTCIYSCVSGYIHKCVCTYIHTNAYSCMSVLYIHTYIYMHAYLHAYIYGKPWLPNTERHPCLSAYKQSFIHTCISTEKQVILELDISTIFGFSFFSIPRLSELPIFWKSGNSGNMVISTCVIDSYLVLLFI